MLINSDVRTKSVIQGHHNNVLPQLYGVCSICALLIASALKERAAVDPNQYRIAGFGGLRGRINVQE